MSPQQAIQIIEIVRQQTNASGKDHDNLREAINVLTQLVNDSEKLKANASPPHNVAN